MHTRGRPSKRIGWACWMATIFNFLVCTFARAGVPPPTPPRSSSAPATPDEQDSEDAAAAENAAKAKPAVLPGGLELGLRLGFALPMGTVAGSTNSSMVKEADFFSNRIPFWFDVGYRLPHLYIGLFLQFGILNFAENAKTGCGQNGISCSGHEIAFGGGLLYHAVPEAVFDPWLGIGIGYEWVSFNQSGNGASGDGSLEGPQYVTVQGGGDIRVVEVFPFGPFVSLSVGQYQKGSVSAGGSSASGDIRDQTLHEWLTFGVRGAFDVKNKGADPSIAR